MKYLLPLLLLGCSAGPQIPVVTTPVVISCTWNGNDGGTMADNDCMVDRSNAEGSSNPTGNVVRDVQASGQVEASVVP